MLDSYPISPKKSLLPSIAEIKLLFKNQEQLFLPVALEIIHTAQSLLQQQENIVRLTANVHGII